MAQWQRAGPITPRSLDRNKLLLIILNQRIFSYSTGAASVHWPAEVPTATNHQRLLCRHYLKHGSNFLSIFVAQPVNHVLASSSLDHKDSRNHVPTPMWKKRVLGAALFDKESMQGRGATNRDSPAASLLRRRLLHATIYIMASSSHLLEAFTSIMSSEKTGKCAILGEEDADVSAKLTAGTSIVLDDKQAARLRHLYIEFQIRE